MGMVDEDPINLSVGFVLPFGGIKNLSFGFICPLDLRESPRRSKGQINPKLGLKGCYRDLGYLKFSCGPKGKTNPRLRL